MKRTIQLLCLLAFFALSGCGGSSSDLSPGGGGGGGGGGGNVIDLKTIELTGPSSLTATGSDPLNPDASKGFFICTLKDTADQPVEGIAVKFSSSLGGTFSPVTATTDANGQATTTFAAPKALGTAQVSAIANLRKSNEIAVTVKQGPPRNLDLFQSASSVGPGENVELTVLVQDNNLFPVVQGTSVTAVVNPNNSGAVGFLGPVATDANGFAKLTYTAGNGTGIDTVKAQSGVISSTGLQIEVSQEAAAIASLDLASTRDAASPLIANNTDTARVTATVKDSDGVGAPNIEVSFTVVSPSGGSVTTKELTDGFGNATKTITAGTKTGAFQVSAAIPAGLYKSLTIPVTAGAAATGKSSVTPTAAVTLKTGQKMNVVVVAKDANGNSVEGEDLIFDINPNKSGASITPATAKTDALGRATVEYTAGLVPTATAADADVVKVSFVGGGFTKPTGAITVEAEQLKDILLSVGASEVIANGTTPISVTASLIDVNGNPAPAGIDVDFATTAGKFGTSNTISKTTGIGGAAQVTLTAPTTIGDAVISASANGFIKTAVIKFVAGPADTSKSTIVANPASIPADGKSTSTITVTLLDANGNPAVADGTSISLFATGGTIISANPVQAVSGRATFTVRSESVAKTITLSTGFAAGLTGTLDFASASDGKPANILLSVSQPHLYVAGVGKTENTTITARIVDIGGNDVPAPATPYNNLRVSWVTHPAGGEFVAGADMSGTIRQIDGSISSMDIYAGAGGTSVSFQSGNLPGVVEVKFEALSPTGSYSPAVQANLSQLVISSGPPHTIVLTYPISDSIENLGSGVYRRKGMAVVSDRYGNSVPNGTTINFGLVDSVIAQGRVDSTSATTLSDANPTLANNTATNLNTAAITRNDVNRSIQPNDRVLILSDAAAGDKSRHVTSKASGSLVVNKAYKTNLAASDYVVGASLLGGFVDGCTDAERSAGETCDTTRFTTGQGMTVGGLVPFRVTYPADGDAIMTGYNSEYDTRVAPIGSARVFVVAASSDDSATTIDEGKFAFAPIAPLALTALPQKLTGSGGVALGLRDGGDGVSVPFYPISSYVQIDTRGKFDYCVSATKTTQATCTGGSVTWYSGGGGYCYDKFITDQQACVGTAEAPRPGWLWVQDIPDLFDIDVYIGESGTTLPADMVAGKATQVDTDLNGVKDFWLYPVTREGGVTSARIMVRGGQYIKSGDSATVVFISGGATANVTVTIP